MTLSGKSLNDLIKPEKDLSSDFKTEYNKNHKQIGTSKWFVIYEIDSKKTYFYNAEDKNTVWDLPPDFVQSNLSLIKEIKARYPHFDLPIPPEQSLGSRENSNYAFSEESEKINCSREPVDVGPIYKEFEEIEMQQDFDFDSEPKKKRVLKTDWWIIDDPKFDKSFYYNTVDRKVDWKLPDEIRKMIPNIQNSKKPSQLNKETDQSQFMDEDSMETLQKYKPNLQQIQRPKKYFKDFQNIQKLSKNAKNGNEFVRKMPQSLNNPKNAKNPLNFAQKSQNCYAFQNFQNSSSTGMQMPARHQGQPDLSTVSNPLHVANVSAFSKMSNVGGVHQMMASGLPAFQNFRQYSHMYHKMGGNGQNFQGAGPFGQWPGGNFKNPTASNTFRRSAGSFGMRNFILPKDDQDRLPGETLLENAENASIKNKVYKKVGSAMLQNGNAIASESLAQNFKSNFQRESESNISLCKQSCCESKNFRVYDIGNGNLESLTEIEKKNLFNAALVQKKVWQTKYIELQDTLTNLEQAILRKQNINSNLTGITDPSQDLKIFQNMAELQKAVFEKIAASDRETLLKTMSTCDLRQSAAMKALYSGQMSLEAIYLILKKESSQNQKKIFADEIHTTYVACEAKPYFCQICSERFEKSNDLESHQKQLHFSPALPTEKDNKCYFCYKTFLSRTTKEIHLRTFHPVEMGFIDDAIELEFQKIRDLRMNTSNVQNRSEIRPLKRVLDMEDSQLDREKYRIITAHDLDETNMKSVNANYNNGGNEQESNFEMAEMEDEINESRPDMRVERKRKEKCENSSEEKNNDAAREKVEMEDFEDETGYSQDSKDDSKEESKEGNSENENAEGKAEGDQEASDEKNEKLEAVGKIEETLGAEENNETLQRNDHFRNKK